MPLCLSIWRLLKHSNSAPEHSFPESLDLYAHVFLTLTLIYTGSRIVYSLCAADCMGVKQKSTEISALLKEKDDHVRSFPS